MSINSTLGVKTRLPTTTSSYNGYHKSIQLAGDCLDLDMGVFKAKGPRELLPMGQEDEKRVEILQSVGDCRVRTYYEASSAS